MSGLLAACRALPRWQWGAPLPTQPDRAHPLCMTPLGWEVSLPPLPDALLFFSAPHRITRCIAGSRSPFPPSTTGTAQGEPGSSPSLDLRVSGKETGFRCLSRSLAATTLRPASPPLLFLPPPARGHSTRHFLKVSLKARDGGHDRFRAQHVHPAGKRTPREVDRLPRIWLGGRSQEPTLRRLAPRPMVSLVGVAVRHLLDWSLKQSNKGRAWGGARRGSFPAGLGSWSGHCGQRLARGCVWTPAGDRWLQAQHLQCPAPSSPFSSRRVFRKEQSRESGVRGAREAPLFSQPRQTLPRGLPLPVLQGAAPPATPRRSLGERRLLSESADDHGGIVGSLSAWAGWKLSSS